VRAVRTGMSIRKAAAKFRLPKSTAAFWVWRGRGSRLDRIDLSDRKPGRASNRMAVEVEQRIAELRIELNKSVLGEYGARAIAAALHAEMAAPPSVATINRVLGRLGLQDAARRIRRPAPPKGWYLPDVVAGRAEVDCFDFIVELKISNGPWIDVLTAKSLHGAAADAWPMLGRSTKRTLVCLLQRWRRDGLPSYAQFDNDNVFQGAHHVPDTIGAVSRLCLQLGVVPVFVPPLEHGMQNAIESFNALWQAKVWQRHRVLDLRELQVRSDQYIAAHRARTTTSRDELPMRPQVPTGFEFRARAPLRGQLIFIRRTNEAGHVSLLGRTFAVSPTWSHRLVRCDVDLTHHQIRCFALRRRAPAEQPLLATIPYHRVDKPFRGAQ
jgi:transposase